MGEVLSFAEETCWRGEDFRAVRKQVGFRIYSIGRHLGEKLDAEFTADYGLWWDQEDEILMFHLEGVSTSVKWRDLVYHKKIDQSGIDIFDPDSDMLVARVEVRAYEGRRLEAVEENLGVNVISFADAGAEVQRKRLLDKAVEVFGESDPEGFQLEDLSTGLNPSSDSFETKENVQREGSDEPNRS